MLEAKPSDLCVLVVEDQMAMRKIIKTVLQHMGVRMVLEAGDGLEALKLLRERNASGPDPMRNYSSKNQPVDYVICDWAMPKLNGLELLQRVRKEIALQDLPFMMLTAENDSEQIKKAIESGVSDYIVKPFSHSLLEKKIRAGLKPETKRE